MAFATVSAPLIVVTYGTCLSSAVRRIEKESIITYSALKQYILPEKQSVLEKVIDEEKKHLVQLTMLRDTLKTEV